MWISRKEYDELISLAFIDDSMTYQEQCEKLKKEIEELKEFVYYQPEPGESLIDPKLTYKRLCEIKAKDLDYYRDAVDTSIKEKSKLAKLAYKDYNNAREITYKDLYEKEIKLNTDLELKVKELKKELRKANGLKLFRLESGEDIEAEETRAFKDSDFIEFLIDGEVVATVEKQAYKVEK